MSVTAESLRELHRIHRQLTDLRGRLSRGPKQINAAQLQLDRLAKEFADAKEALTRARVASDEKQLQLKQREDRIADLKSKLNSASSNKEFQALKEQIAADQQANSVLSDEILEGLEKLDELQTVVSEAETQSTQAKTEVDAIRSRIAKQHGALESELARVQAELDVAEARLPADFKDDYLRKTKVHGEDALGEVDGECCGVCNQVLRPQTMNELQLEMLVICGSCGAMLYLPEDRTL